LFFFQGVFFFGFHRGERQELGARLAGRDLEVCALETLLASASKKDAQEERTAEALRTAQEEAKCLGGAVMGIISGKHTKSYGKWQFL
jgi:sugar phosphate isomerase/epimerase